MMPSKRHTDLADTNFKYFYLWSRHALTCKYQQLKEDMCHLVNSTTLDTNKSNINLAMPWDAK